MKRLLMLTLAVSMANVSAAFAGETLLESAGRVARETARTLAVKDAVVDPVTTRAERLATVPSFAAALPVAQSGPAVLAQQAPGLEASGMSGARKALIAIVTGVVVAGAMWTIDHKVEDNTPSSHGLRVDLNN